MNYPRLNKALSAANIIIALYILIMPFFPSLLFWLHKKTAVPPVIVSQVSADNPVQPPTPQGNRIIIPSILINEPINEGPTSATLSKGIWRIPTTSTPAQKGNTVMAGHVFTYYDPEGVFYNLSKVQVGDELAVYWEGDEYLYTVREVNVVPSTAIEIEAPTPNSQLTLYTCTPIWHPINRLVVISDLTKVTEL